MKVHSGRLLLLLPCATAVLAFLFLLDSAGILAGSVGLSHDELWDYIPSVGMLKGESLSMGQEAHISGYPFPLVTGPYQGALKTWISAPLLLAAGTSPRAIRTLNVLFSMVYLLALYWALLPAAGRKWACDLDWVI